MDCPNSVLFLLVGLEYRWLGGKDWSSKRRLLRLGPRIRVDPIRVRIGLGTALGDVGLRGFNPIITVVSFGCVVVVFLGASRRLVSHLSVLGGLCGRVSRRMVGLGGKFCKGIVVSRCCQGKERR